MPGKEHVEKMGKPNDGIKCVVDTCFYNANGNHCMAELIEIQPKNARNSEDTDCSTFKPRS